MPELDPIVQDIIANASQFIVEMHEATNAALAASEATDRMLAETEAMARAAIAAAGAEKYLANQLKDIRTAYLNAAAAAAINNAAMAATVVTTRTVGDAGNAWRVWGTGIRLTSTALHGVVSGIIEFLAVAIPATVAAGAWAAVWAQGAQMVGQHMKALWTAAEATGKMFHTTAGDILVGSHALQAAQDAANPNVYQALGSVILILREHFQNLANTGLQVGRIFDTFMAKLVYDFSAAGGAGGKMNTVLNGMIPAITMFGQIIGNLGHALLNLAAAMPGLAFVMLKIADAISGLILRFSQLPTWIIYGIFALHEFNTWGSVLVGTLDRLGGTTTALSGSFFGLSRGVAVFMALFRVAAMIIPNVIGLFGMLLMGIGRFIPAMSRAGMALFGFGGTLTSIISKIGPLQAGLIVLGAVALGFLIDKLVTARSAAQQFVDQLQQTIETASNWKVLSVIGVAMGQLQAKMIQAMGTIRQFQAALANQGSAVASARGLGAVNVALGQSEAAWATYANGLDHAARQVGMVTSNAQMLAATYHTTIPGAIALASQANVSLTANLRTANGQWTQQGLAIKSLVQGFQAMGAPMGAVGNDMTYLAIQSGLAGTKVSQLNSAFSEFMTNLTGGTSGLANFNQALANLRTVPATTGIANLSRASDNGKLSIKDFAKAMTSFSGTGATAWQNFNQVVNNTAPQLINWLRIAGAEGAISGAKFQKGILDMLAPLVPLAAKSKAAQTELMGLVSAAGLNIKTFPELQAAIKRTHANVGDLGAIIAGTTTKMGNMGSVAQALGNIMNGVLAQAISDAALKASGFYQKTAALTQALQHNAANSPAVEQAAAAVTKAWDKAQAMAATLAGQANNAANAINHIPKNTDVFITTHFGTVGTPGPGVPWSPSSGIPRTRQADQGALLPPGLSMIANNTGKFEAILTPGQIGSLLGVGAAAAAQGGVIREVSRLASAINGLVQWLPTEFPGTPGIFIGGHHRRMIRDLHPSFAGPSGFSTSWQTWRAYEGPWGASGHPAHGRHPVQYSGGPIVHVHVHGSMFGTMQEITRAVQTGLNQKTLRNGSTQTFISGRKH